MPALKDTSSLNIGKHFELPSVPLVLTRLIQALNDDSASAQRLEELILHDPSLAARVLRLANSAFYSFRDEVKTVSRAISLLGLDLVKSLAISVQLFDSFMRGMTCEAELINRLWMHSFGTGLLSQQIWRRRSNRREAEFAFLCGLMHDLGKAVFFKKDPVQYGALFGRQKGPEDEDISTSEIQAYGVDHATLGAVLVREWGLPATLGTTIQRHHAPVGSLEPLGAAVQLADALAQEVGIGCDGERLRPPTTDLYETYKGALQMGSEEYASLLGSGRETRKLVETFFRTGA